MTQLWRLSQATYPPARRRMQVTGWRVLRKAAKAASTRREPRPPQIAWVLLREKLTRVIGGPDAHASGNFSTKVNSEG
jgi:hypothetical protein